MAIVLFNPTNEDMETQYIGETVIIKSGSKVRVDDARGKHVLNTLGPRGLMSLEYGDEGEKEDIKRTEGINRNMAFKRKQVVNFNQYNEQRYQARLPYLAPTKQLQEYAKELGIGLREPYNVEDAAVKEMSDLKKEISAKDQQLAQRDRTISEMQGQISELSALMKQFVEKGAGAAKDLMDETDKAKQEADGLDVDLRKLSKNNMADWLMKNWNLTQKYPDEVKAKIANRFETLYGELMPANKADLEKFLEKLAA